MKKILFLLSVLLSAVAFSQGHETFDNLDLTGNSYTGGSFVGQDGVSWTFGEARGDLEINGKAITLGRNRPSPMFLESGTIANGVGTLEFSYMQAFSTGVALEVMVNGNLVYTATSDGEQEVIKSSGVITVEVEGDIILKFNNPDGSGQVAIDDIIWTAYENTTGIYDINTVEFNYFPNPTKDVLNFSSNILIEDVQVFNLLGQQVMGVNLSKKDQINVSSLPSGSYIMRVQFENGTQKSFKILKQ